MTEYQVPPFTLDYLKFAVTPECREKTIADPNQGMIFPQSPEDQARAIQGHQEALDDWSGRKAEDVEQWFGESMPIELAQGYIDSMVADQDRYLRNELRAKEALKKLGYQYE